MGSRGHVPSVEPRAASAIFPWVLSAAAVTLIAGCAAAMAAPTERQPPPAPAPPSGSPDCSSQSGGCELPSSCAGTVDAMGNCVPCLAGSISPWQIHLGDGPSCFGRTFDRHGDPGEYEWAQIPAADDGGWSAHGNAISFDDPSTLCGVCDCLAGADFTYFQTTVEVPPGYSVDTLSVTIGVVDDGVRVTIFNAAHPDGIVDEGSYAYLGGGSTTDLADLMVEGQNRIVLTHLDDCCEIRKIASVEVELNGRILAECGEEPAATPPSDGPI